VFFDTSVVFERFLPRPAMASLLTSEPLHTPPLPLRSVVLWLMFLLPLRCCSVRKGLARGFGDPWERVRWPLDGIWHAFAATESSCGFVRSALLSRPVFDTNYQRFRFLSRPARFTGDSLLAHLFGSNTPSPFFFFEKRFCSRGSGEANRGGEAEARCLRRRRGPVMTHSSLRTTRMLRYQPEPALAP